MLVSIGMSAAGLPGRANPAKTADSACQDIHVREGRGNHRAARSMD
jgi:hypothetical protein